MLDDTTFLAIASATLMHLADQLEDAYDDGHLDEVELDEGNGILTIITAASAQTFVVSRHGPSRQLWLASPVSGGLHFEFGDAQREWVLPDGKTLKSILAADLQKTAKIHIVF